MHKIRIAISKQDIPAVRACTGKANAETCIIDGVLYEVGTCRLAGRLLSGAYDPRPDVLGGHFHLDVPPADCERVSFIGVPGLNATLPENTITTPEEPAASTVIDDNTVGIDTESEECDVCTDV